MDTFARRIVIYLSLLIKVAITNFVDAESDKQSDSEKNFNES